MTPDLCHRWESNRVLDAVERWADGYRIIRETGIVNVGGRIDALLIPFNKDAHCMKDTTKAFFDRPRLLGVEVKVSRSDFHRGLREGQFDRYAAALSGLYVAAPHGIIKTAEIPDGVGHLVIRGEKCVCKRHPNYRDVDVDRDVPWRLLFHLYTEEAKRRREQWQRDEKFEKRLGDLAGVYVFNALYEIQQAVKRELGEKSGQ